MDRLEDIVAVLEESTELPACWSENFIGSEKERYLVLAYGYCKENVEC